MKATPQEFDLTSEDLRREVTEAVKAVSGDAIPLFDGQDQYPRVWDINDLANRPRAEWFIRGIVEERGLCVFFAPDKVGKTAVLSNFLWAWVGYHEWFLSEEFKMKDKEGGITPFGDGRKVLYVLLEGQANFYARYEAWCSAYNKGLPIDGFYVMDEGLSLWSPSMNWEDTTTWTVSAKRLWNAVSSLKPNILVIDTLSRATAGMDENSSSMSQVVGMLDNMRDVFDLATVIVHHSSLADGDRPRGHSSLKGAASSYVRIEGKPEDDILTLVTGPHRNSDEYVRVMFRKVSKNKAFVIVNERPRLVAESVDRF